MRLGQRRRYNFLLAPSLELSCHAMRKSKLILTEKPQEKVKEENRESNQQLTSTANCVNKPSDDSSPQPSRPPAEAPDFMEHKLSLLHAVQVANPWNL